MHARYAFLLVAQQQTAAPVSPIARVVVTPAARSVVVGDTLRLRARALDAQGRPVSHAVIRVSLLPGPTARIDVTPAPGRMLAGQRLRLATTTLAPTGHVREDRVA